MDPEEPQQTSEQHLRTSHKLDREEALALIPDSDIQAASWGFLEFCDSSFRFLTLHVDFHKLSKAKRQRGLLPRHQLTLAQTVPQHPWSQTDKNRPPHRQEGVGTACELKQSSSFVFLFHTVSLSRLHTSSHAFSIAVGFPPRPWKLARCTRTLSIWQETFASSFFSLSLALFHFH